MIYRVYFHTDRGKKWVIIRGFDTLDEAIDMAKEKWKDIMEYNEAVSIRIEAVQDQETAP